MHHDSDWNYVNRADQNRVPNLSRARFDYKRKDEDDMAKSTKTYEERIRALEKKEQESIPTMLISLACFITIYEIMMYIYSEKIKKISIKEIMIE